MSLNHANMRTFSLRAEAALSTRSEDGGFQGDSLIKAQLSFLCIYAFLYLVLSVLCASILLRKARNCFGVYVTLFLSLLFAIIYAIASIFHLVIQQGGITPSQSSVGPTTVALAALENFFDFWSRPLLFLSICMLIRDRHSSLHKAGVSSVFPVVYYVVFALLMVFGTVAASLVVNYLSILLIGNRLEGHTLGWLNKKVAISNDLGYTFSALWYLSSIITLAYAAFVHREMRRLSLRDKVLRVVLFGVLPAYILLVVEEFTFTILTSPAGIKVNPFTNITQIEAVNFSSVFLSNLFLSIMYGIMVALGLSRSAWYAKPADMIPL